MDKDKNYKGKKNKFKGKRTNSNGNVSKEPTASNTSHTGEGEVLNDLKWFTANPELTLAAAQLPFPNRPGMSVPMKWNGNTDTVVDVPGVIAIRWAPAIGTSASSNSPATIMARTLYTRVRSAFSSELDVDPPDLLMYCLALDELHAYLTHLKRVYGLLGMYTGHNFDYPITILKALGIEPSATRALQKDKTAVWGRINTLILSANRFLLPDQMHIVSRHRWMNENVYLDEPSRMAQSYVFTMDGYHVLDYSGETGTALKYVSLLGDSDSPINTIDKLFKPAEDMLTAIETWGDAKTIDGYLRRAFSDAPFVETPLLSADYILTPVYSAEVLLEIENAHAVNMYLNDTFVSTLNVTQNPATAQINFAPMCNMSGVKVSPYLNLHTDVPSPMDVVIATRLCCTCGNPNAGNYPVIAGTEIVTSIRYVLDGGNVSQQLQQVYRILNYNSTWQQATVQEAVNFMRSQMVLSWFTHAPLGVLVGSYVPGSMTPDISWIRGDMHNFNVFSEEALEKLHRVCVYSEFNCFAV